MAQHTRLFIPGPCDVDDDVLTSLAQPVMQHYGPAWMEVYTETLALLKQVFQTQNDLFMAPAPATALLDMAFGSLLATGEQVIVGHNGFFGERLVAVARSYGLDVVTFSAPAGKPLLPDDLQRLLQSYPAAKAVAVVHHETATTVLNPLCELAEVTHRAGRVIIVDAVSSLGGVKLPVDEWEIDVCVTAANKCLEAPPGMAFISVSPRAWELVERPIEFNHGWYLALKTWRTYAQEWKAWHPYPVTLPTNNILALRTSLRKIVANGLSAHLARFAYASRAVRAGLQNIGFEMLVPAEYAAPVATAVRVQPAFPLGELVNWLLTERNIMVGGGLNELAGKIFRVGHLGKAATREYLMDFLFAVEEFLRFKGMNIPLGASLIGL